MDANLTSPKAIVGKQTAKQTKPTKNMRRTIIISNSTSRTQQSHSGKQYRLLAVIRGVPLEKCDPIDNRFFKICLLTRQFKRPQQGHANRINSY
jgi:hypothetical protein